MTDDLGVVGVFWIPPKRCWGGTVTLILTTGGATVGIRSEMLITTLLGGADSTGLLLLMTEGVDTMTGAITLF